MFQKFWAWYKRHEKLNLGLAAGLFLLQIFHLYWLSATVVFTRLFDVSYFHPHPWLEFILIFVDYLEIPTLIGVSLIYLNELRAGFKTKSAFYLLLVNTQWLHIFWITDEFVVDKLTGAGGGTVLPVWLAWVAIGIDYLELPVIYDTVKRFISTMKKDGLRASFSVIKESE